MKPVFGCVNNTIRLRSGCYFDLANPNPEHFTFADIAGALSKICRFGGQIDCFYSVAEHLLHCADQAQTDGLPVETQRAVLLHDAAEAFVGDMVKPLKIMLPEYSVIESRVEMAIAEKFGVDLHGVGRDVSKIDREMLIAERHAFFSRDNVTWTGENEVRRLNRKFLGWNPRLAEEHFTSFAAAIGIDIRS